MELVQQAAETAEHFVAPLGRRWEHVQAVAARASELSDAVPPQDRDTLVAAAWLHDIGYAPEIGHTKYDERIEEIFSRYAPEDPVHRT